MLRFFRQIRQRLLTENKVSRYLLYAIGEIFLIVLGIMIALQLDNSNEQRKEEAEMVQSLKELTLELESNIKSSHNILYFYNNRDSLIRQHLCHSITREELSDQWETHWDLGTMRYTVSLGREVFDKVLANLEKIPVELEHLKPGLRWLDGAYKEMQGNNNNLLEITDAEGNYRAQNNSWNHELWIRGQPLEAGLKTKVLNYLLDNSHYQNHLQRLWSQISRNTVPDILGLRLELIYQLEMITNFLEPGQSFTYGLPEDFRFDLSGLTGTYRVWSKSFDGEGQEIEMGNYILFEEEGRLFSFTRFDPQRQTNVQSDEKVEWLVLDPKTVISPTAWFMHLINKDSAYTALEYAGCNNRNLYFTKIK